MPRKILLIDDDRLQFRIAQAHFAAMAPGAYELVWEATYDAGLERLRSGEFDACLLDYQLGERDGLQLIREAVAGGCRTPIVFLTAETARRVDLEAMEAGAVDYLIKGEISPRMLERSLRYALKLGDTLEALRRLATRDDLTGLLNRREFDRILQEEAERALRFGRPLGLVMLDLDRFKAINDTHGHVAGDVVLREIARRFGAEVRTVDRIARFGGDEFALVLMEADRSAALHVAQRVCASIRRRPVELAPGRTVHVSASAGVASLPQDAATPAELVTAADQALYAAKAAGRDRAAPGRASSARPGRPRGVMRAS